MTRIPDKAILKFGEPAAIRCDRGPEIAIAKSRTGLATTICRELVSARWVDDEISGVTFDSVLRFPRVKALCLHRLAINSDSHYFGTACAFLRGSCGDINPQRIRQEKLVMKKILLILFLFAAR